MNLTSSSSSVTTVGNAILSEGIVYVSASADGLCFVSEKEHKQETVEQWLRKRVKEICDLGKLESV